MKFSSFLIENYKGIESVRLDFDSIPHSNIYTFVGLNESGKTTILSALNYYQAKIGSENLDPLQLAGYNIPDVHDLIPISKRSNFNENIVLEASYELDDDDNRKLKEYMLKEGGYELTESVPTCTVECRYKFRDSKLMIDGTKSYWRLKLVGRSAKAPGKGGRKKPPSELSSAGETSEIWLKAVNFVKTLLPSVLYFPNFLFDFPDKIYLEDPETLVETEKEKHQFYRTLLQDVLDSIDEGLNLQRHILARAKATSRHERTALDSTLLKMGSNITTTVLENWNRIFKHKIGKKEIDVSYDQDEVGWFLQLRIKDGDSLYAISERSLGFRWFFAFLLLTQYRGFRKDAPKSVLFLLDEPASNLHSSAQSELLESFGKFPPSCTVIYTTHSHHMINPDWLEGTFVVKNEGLDYDSATADNEYNSKKTRITLDRYRSFVAKHPNQSTYFQPILEVLDYNPGKLENVPNVVMTEGKNDYYTLKYFHDKVLSIGDPINLMPGGGAGSLDNAIRIYLAWGRQFIVLLDSDKAGSREKKRYEGQFGAFVRDRIFSLEDIDPAWRNKSMESLIEEDDRMYIQRLAYPDVATYGKTHFNRAIQELYLTGQVPALSDATKGNMKRILEFSRDVLGKMA